MKKRLSAHLQVGALVLLMCSAYMAGFMCASHIATDSLGYIALIAGTTFLFVTQIFVIYLKDTLDGK